MPYIMISEVNAIVFDIKSKMSSGSYFPFEGMVIVKCLPKCNILSYMWMNKATTKRLCPQLQHNLDSNQSDPHLQWQIVPHGRPLVTRDSSLNQRIVAKSVLSHDHVNYLIRGTYTTGVFDIYIIYIHIYIYKEMVATISSVLRINYISTFPARHLHPLRRQVTSISDIDFKTGWPSMIFKHLRPSRGEKSKQINDMSCFRLFLAITMNLNGGCPVNWPRGIL